MLNLGESWKCIDASEGLWSISSINLPRLKCKCGTSTCSAQALVESITVKFTAYFLAVQWLAIVTSDKPGKYANSAASKWVEHKNLSLKSDCLLRLVPWESFSYKEKFPLWLIIVILSSNNGVGCRKKVPCSNYPRTLQYKLKVSKMWRIRQYLNRCHRSLSKNIFHQRAK